MGILSAIFFTGKLWRLQKCVHTLIFGERPFRANPFRLNFIAGIYPEIFI